MPAKENVVPCDFCEAKYRTVLFWSSFLFSQSENQKMELLLPDCPQLFAPAFSAGNLSLHNLHIRSPNLALAYSADKYIMKPSCFCFLKLCHFNQSPASLPYRPKLSSIEPARFPLHGHAVPRESQDQRSRSFHYPSH